MWRGGKFCNYRRQTELHLSNVTSVMCLKMTWGTIRNFLFLKDKKKQKKHFLWVWPAANDNTCPCTPPCMRIIQVCLEDTVSEPIMSCTNYVYIAQHVFQMMSWSSTAHIFKAVFFSSEWGVTWVNCEFLFIYLLNSESCEVVGVEGRWTKVFGFNALWFKV